MVILRYKIYETSVLGVKEAVISASIRHTEIETPIDLFGSIDEPTIAPEPEFEVTFSNGESEILNQQASTEQWQEEEEEVEELILEKEEEPIIEEDEVVEPIQAVEEHILEEEKEEEPIQEEEEIEEPIQTFEDPIQKTEAPTPWEPEFSGDQPIWMAEMEANIRDNRSVFPLESLIGAFTLNEKLQFINELFDGSSDEFSSNVKQLDQLASIDAARNMIAELAATYTWDTDSEIVEDFMYKICRRYATGA
jgi:outer membrane biosynthesis protein TonB